MSTRLRARQLTLFDDLEVAIPVAVESPLPSATDHDPAHNVPAIDVSRVRRRRPANQPELDGLR